MISLKQSYDFMRLKKEGKITRSCHWFFVNYQKNNELGVRLGLTVPRYCGKAVTRNKLKRWCKDFFRNFDESLDYDINIIYKKMPERFYENLRHETMVRHLVKCVSNVKKN